MKKILKAFSASMGPLSCFFTLLTFLYYPECVLITIDFPDTVQGSNAPSVQVQAFFFLLRCKFLLRRDEGLLL